MVQFAAGLLALQALKRLQLLQLLPQPVANMQRESSITWLTARAAHAAGPNHGQL